MKNSKLFVTKNRPKKNRIPKLKSLFLFLLLFFLHLYSYSQFDQLLQEAQEFRNNSKSLAQEIVSIIKIIASVAVGITALTYLYIRNQNSDLADRLGKVIIGIAIFYALLSVGEAIGNI